MPKIAVFVCLLLSALASLSLSACQSVQDTTATKIVHNDKEASSPVAVGAEGHLKCKAFGAFTADKARELYLAGATHDSLQHYNLTRNKQFYGEVTPETKFEVVGQQHVGLMNVHVVEVRVASGEHKGKTMFFPRQLIEVPESPVKEALSPAK